MIRSRACVIVAFACFIKVSESQCATATSTANQQPLSILNKDNPNIAALSNLVKNVISLTANNGINANYLAKLQSNNQQQPIQTTAPNLSLQLPTATSSNLGLLYQTPLTQNIAQVPSTYPLQQSNTFVPLSMSTASPVINTLTASLTPTVSTCNAENPIVNIQQSSTVPEYNEEPLILYLNVESQETPELTQISDSVSPLIEIAVMSEEYLSSLLFPSLPQQPPVVVVKDKKSSSLNKILPLLLLTLKDKSPSYPFYCSTSNNNCCNNDCGCSMCNNVNGPILYPMPIPVNSPFVSSDVKI